MLLALDNKTINSIFFLYIQWIETNTEGALHLKKKKLKSKNINKSFWRIEREAIQNR